VKASVTDEWAALDHHFKRQMGLLHRFKNANANSVRWMWKHQTNEAGNHLTQFEREALIERHCELFGTWPE